MALITPSVTCKCNRGKRRPPIRVIPDAVFLLRPLLEGVPPNTVLMTYKCGDCQTLIEIKLSDLALVTSADYGLEARA